MANPLRSATWHEYGADDEHVGDGLATFLDCIADEGGEVEIVHLAQSTTYDIDAADHVTVTTVIYRLLDRDAPEGGA